MPPWHAQPGHQECVNDASLTAEEIDTVLAWVDGGSLRDNAADLPDAPEFITGWTIGEPDAVYSMMEPFDVPADGTVLYLYFTHTDQPPGGQVDQGGRDRAK